MHVAACSFLLTSMCLLGSAARSCHHLPGTLSSPGLICCLFLCFRCPLCHRALSLYVNPQLLSINMEWLFITRFPGLTSAYKHLSCGGTKTWCTARCRGRCLFTSKLKVGQTTNCFIECVRLLGFYSLWLYMRVVWIWLKGALCK